MIVYNSCNFAKKKQPRNKWRITRRERLEPWSDHWSQYENKIQNCRYRGGNHRKWEGTWKKKNAITEDYHLKKKTIVGWVTMKSANGTRKRVEDKTFVILWKKE